MFYRIGSLLFMGEGVKCFIGEGVQCSVGEEVQCFIGEEVQCFIVQEVQCVSEPPRGRVSAELSKPVERKGALWCVVLV